MLDGRGDSPRGAASLADRRGFDYLTSVEGQAAEAGDDELIEEVAHGFAQEILYPQQIRRDEGTGGNVHGPVFQIAPIAASSSTYSKATVSWASKRYLKDRRNRPVSTGAASAMLRVVCAETRSRARVATLDGFGQVNQGPVLDGADIVGDADEIVVTGHVPGTRGLRPDSRFCLVMNIADYADEEADHVKAKHAEQYEVHSVRKPSHRRNAQGR